MFSKMLNIERLSWLSVFVLIGFPFGFGFMNGDANESTQDYLSDDYLFNDAHFHLTNYVQKGTDIESFIDIMGSKVYRSTLFGIPLQQQWSYRISGNNPPTYYLESDAPLYYYSFTDAYIAKAYQSLPEVHQQRFDPMITGFNPTDMYAADHIRRVLVTFPNVFTGIGEFTVHKEFVSSKIAGEVASLADPALDSILSLAEEVGLVVLMHNDIDIPFARGDEVPAYLAQMKALLKKHPKTNIIWAHIGLGRVIHPVRSAHKTGTARSHTQINIVKDIMNDPSLSHVYFDISWDEVAKYIIRNDSTINAAAELFNTYPERFLFGTDLVAPEDPKEYFKLYDQYNPLWDKLNSDTKEKICKENYIRIFDEARRRVRAWEKLNVDIAHMNYDK